MQQGAKSKHYRYKLNENSKVDRMSINGVVLTKNWSSGYMNPKDELESYIMTNKNPSGIVDLEIFIPANNTIVYNNREAMNRDVPIYTVEELQSMNRDQLVKVAEYYGINPIRRANHQLISLITVEQKERADKEESVVDAPEPVTPAEALTPKQKDALMPKRRRKKKEDPDRIW